MEFVDTSQWEPIGIKPDFVFVGIDWTDTLVREIDLGLFETSDEEEDETAAKEEVSVQGYAIPKPDPIILSEGIEMKHIQTNEPQPLSIEEENKEEEEIPMEMTQKEYTTRPSLNHGSFIPQTLPDKLSPPRQSTKLNVRPIRLSQPEQQDEVIITEDNIMDQVNDTSSTIFRLEVQKGPKWVLLDWNVKEPVLIAIPENKINSRVFVIFKYSDQTNPIARISSNISRKEFTTLVYDEQGKREESAVVFKQSIITPDIGKPFVAFIPTERIPAEEKPQLKKGGPNSYPMEAAPPIYKNGMPTQYFGGTVRKASVKNFILIPSEGTKQRIMVFGKHEDNVFVGTVFSPLSTFQAFSIALAFFK